MNVILVSLYYNANVASGANKRFDETGKKFYREKIPLEIVVPKGQRPSWCLPADCIEIESPKFFFSFLKRLYFFISLTIYLLNKQKASFVISDFMPIPFWGLKKHVHLQLMHDMRNFTSFNRAKFSQLSSAWQCRQWRKSQYILTVSKLSKSSILKYCDICSDKVVISYNGISKMYEKAEIDFTELREIDVTYVAWFEKRKNHIALLKAVKVLKNRGLALNVLLIGKDNGTLKTVLDFIKANDLTNEVAIESKKISEEDLFNRYKNTKVYVSPSLYEGFGMPLIESMSLGCKVTCSNIDVFKEICQSHATYFDPNSPKDIADKVEYSIQSSTDSIEKSSVYAKNMYKWDNTLKPIINLLNKKMSQV